MLLCVEKGALELEMNVKKWLEIFMPFFFSQKGSCCCKRDAL